MPNLTKIVHLVEQTYKQSGFQEPRRRGRITFSDLYLCQLVIVQHLKGYTNESAFLRSLHRQRQKAFPRIPTQSCYNHRAKKLAAVTDSLMAILPQKLDVKHTKIRVVDATAVPVVKYYRCHTTKSFQNKRLFGIGYCAARKEYFYGQKLTLVINQHGIPVRYHLMPDHCVGTKAAYRLPRHRRRKPLAVFWRH